MKPLVAFIGCFLMALPASGAEPVDYVRDVKPILAGTCYRCHGPDKERSGLRLDTVAAALAGGNSGPAIVPGKSGRSRLIRAVSGADGVKAMPPTGKRLTARQIALLKAWIDQGARAPATEMTAQRTRSRHWAFQPVRRPRAPAVKNRAWVRNPIDRFILARLEKEGIAPSPEANRTTLLRRLSFDLRGLPPSPREVEEFLADRSPDAYERLVDRLLASPQYGERWGRHWLDLARYADSNGFNIDNPRSIWPYRDWVIAALNRDLPFDRFAVEQIAGDLLPGATVAQKIATGFHRNTLLNQEGGIDVEQFRVESVVDRVNTTGAVFLGLTVGCAQCHNHKFDPISQREYYQLFAFLNNADEPTLAVGTPEQVARHAALRAQLAAVTTELDAYVEKLYPKQLAWEKALTAADRKKLGPRIQAILDTPLARRTDAERGAVRRAFLTADVGFQERQRTVAQLRARLPKIPTTLVLQERAKPRPTYIHRGGDFLRKGARVSPGVPAVLHPLTLREREAPAEPNVGHSLREWQAATRGASGLQKLGSNLERPTSTTPRLSNRLDLARWLVDPKNPLTPRVTVNRFWQHYFGTGLVETENDFGTQGTPPTHPELLDYLAGEFIRCGWSVKAMQRLIVTSATYRQSSRARPDLAGKDPRNKLLARQTRLRLEAETVRDAALAASGLLSGKVGGPSVFPPQPEGVFAFTQIPRVWQANTGPDRYRRGLYTYFWRSAPHPALTVFDAPDSTTTCTRRNRSNTPLQALTLLNDQAFVEFAQGLARRVLRETPAGDAGRIRFAFHLCLARSPSAREEGLLRRLFDRQLAEFRAQPKEAEPLVPARLPPRTDRAQLAAWTVVARVLLNLDEFITRE
jgi:mono/diheme cytochrome c family protein